MAEFAFQEEGARLAHYRRFVYEKGGLLEPTVERFEGLTLTDVDRFRYRKGYFTDSGIIGTKAFVSRMYQNFKSHFISRHEKVPKRIQGLEGIYSLKRLSESIS